MSVGEQMCGSVGTERYTPRAQKAHLVGSDGKTPVADERVRFSQNSQKFGNRKCLPEARTSIVGHPLVNFSPPPSTKALFQLPRLVFASYRATTRRDAKKSRPDRGLGLLRNVSLAARIWQIYLVTFKVICPSVLLVLPAADWIATI